MKIKKHIITKIILIIILTFLLSLFCSIIRNTNDYINWDIAKTEAIKENNNELSYYDKIDNYFNLKTIILIENIHNQPFYKIIFYNLILTISYIFLLDLIFGIGRKDNFFI